MKSATLLLCVISLVSCTHSNHEKEIKKKNSPVKNKLNILNNTIQLHDTTVMFLWREKKFNKVKKEYGSCIVINKDYSHNLSEPVKAALAYVATWVGNECRWENDIANLEKTNLQCVILSSLKLGCQGSKQHLDFLRKWFRNDSTAISELNEVPITPSTSTVQNTFNKIKITVKGNNIIIWYKASGIFLSENKTWHWTQTDIFEVQNNSIRLKKSKIEKDNSFRI